MLLVLMMQKYYQRVLAIITKRWKPCFLRNGFVKPKYSRFQRKHPCKSKPNIYCQSFHEFSFMPIVNQPPNCLLFTAIKSTSVANWLLFGILLTIHKTIVSGRITIFRAPRKRFLVMDGDRHQTNSSWFHNMGRIISCSCLLETRNKRL